MKNLPLSILIFIILLACGDGPTTGDEPEKPPTYQGEWGSWGSGDGEFEVPADVGIGPDGTVYVADSYNYRIQYFTPSGSYLGKWGTKGEGKGEFENEVKMLAVAPTGNVYVPDADSILYFSSNGRFLGEWATPELTTLGIDVARDGTVYVAEYDRRYLRAGIRRYTASGSFLSLNTGNHPSSEGPFESLDDVAVLPSGDILTLDGTIYTADMHNSRIQYFR
jgi:tripartite motif-containing protein 71